MSKDQYIQWLESTVVNNLNNDILCERLVSKCGIWCKNNCEDTFNIECLRYLAETDIWEE